MSRIPSSVRASKAVLLWPVGLVLLAACGESDLAGPDLDGPAFVISDGAHADGNPDFFFLPPMVPNPSSHPSFDPDGFDATLSPRIEICEVEVADCAATQAAGFPIVFDMTSGSGSEVVRVSEVDEHYHANWHTKNFDLDVTITYRIQVYVESQRLGFADVDLVSSGSELKNVDTGQYIALKDGRTLPIKFRIELGAVAPPVTEIVVDGTDRRFGPLPAIPYALAENETGEDIYPLGEGAFYLFGLYDTGTTRVRIYNELPYFFNAFPDPNGGLTPFVPHRLTDGNFFNSDAALLGLTDEVTARVRLNGLAAIDPVTLNAPIGLGGAQLEVSGIPVRPEPLDPNRPMRVTLIGGEINNSVVASIDYTMRIERSPYDFYPGLVDRTPAGTGVPDFSPIDFVDGPDITFFPPGDAAIPALPLEFPLTRLGVPAVRYGVVDIEFRDGANVFDTQDPGLPSPSNILFDTGTTITLIGDAIANALALVAGAGTFDCLGGASNGYVIDAIVMSGPTGTYTVNESSICWRQEVVPLFLDAITGSNLFDQVPIVFDGAADRLWIGEPTTSPVVW